MDQIDVFSVRDLRNRSGDLLKEAEAGQIWLVTKHGRPAILTVPLDELLIGQGVHRGMALHLFESHQLTLAQAARLAGLSREEFVELLGEVGIPTVDCPAADLESDLAVALSRRLSLPTPVP